MASADGTRRPTLLPYLQGEASGAALKLRLLPGEDGQGEKAFPFDLLDDTGPVSRLIEADFVTDAGVSLKKSVLEVQKDRYALAIDELRPVTNRDVDAAWRDVLLAERGGEGVSRVLLSCQVDAEGALTPLEPLFFCRERRVFFHPPCPGCGRDLHLCSDDGLLRRFGLAPYSKSLKRYLHCPQCTEEGRASFYVYEHDHRDHATVKDRWSLIEEFGEIDGGTVGEGGFPCLRCQDHAGCYATGSLCRQRIVPFSFYPFYLLAAESPSLNGLDFLQLVSGATFDEVAEALDPDRATGRMAKLERAKKSGVAAVTLFPHQDERSFLELLFIKLSFLGALLHELLVRPELRMGRIRSDRIWVQIPDRSAAFPACWGFSVEIVGEVNPLARNRAVAGLTSAEELGLFWFQALCQNSEVGQADLFEALSGWLMKRNGVATRKPALVSPRQIFWHPGRRAVNDEWRALWDRACEPGYLLLQSSTNAGAEVDCQELIGMIDALRLEVRSIIFEGAPLAGMQPREEGNPVADGRGSPVDSILSTMRAGEATGLPPAGNSSSDDDETVETVILSPDSPRLRQNAVSTGIPLEETVMLPPAGQGKDGDTPQRGVGTFLETLLGTARTISAQPGQKDEIALLETVVAALPTRVMHNRAGEGVSHAGAPQLPKEPSEEEKLLDETIIVPPPGRPRPR